MATESLAPDALLQQDNLSGVVADIDDDPDAPDNNWLTAVDHKTDSICRVSFPTPSAAPNTGIGLQEFRFQIRESNFGGSNIPWSIHLYENGTDLGEIASGTLTNGAIVINGTWDAVNLTNADGSGVEAYILFTAQVGGQRDRNTGEVGAVEWNADVTAGDTFFQTLAVTASGAVVLSPAPTFLQTLAATATGSAVLSLTKTFFRIFTVTASGAASLATTATHFISLAVTATSSATLSTAIKFVQALSATASGTTSLATEFVTGITLAVAATGNAALSVVPIFTQVLSATVSGVASLAKKTSKTLVVTANATASLGTTVIYLVSLAATAAGAATLGTAIKVLQTLSTTALGAATLTTKFIAGAAATLRSKLGGLSGFSMFRRN